MIKSKAPDQNLDLKFLIHYFFSEYLPAQRGLSKNTIKSYRDTFKIFYVWVSNETDAKTISIEAISADLILKFLSDLEATRKNDIKTRNSRLAALKSFFSMCYMRRAVDRRHFESINFVPFKKFHRKLIDYFEHDDVLKIFSLINTSRISGARDQVVLNLLYDTGIRATELASLKVKNYDANQQTLEILGKGNRWRKIFIWPRTAKILDEYLRSRPVPKPAYKDFLITNHKRESLTRSGVHKISSKYLKMANIDKHIPSSKRSAAHSWRHTSAVNMLKMGFSIQEIKVRLGHQQMETTSKYLNLDLTVKRERILELLQFSKTSPPKLDDGNDIKFKSSVEIIKFLEGI